MLEKAIMNGEVLFNLVKFCLSWLKNGIGYSIKHLFNRELLSSD